MECRDQGRESDDHHGQKKMKRCAHAPALKPIGSLSLLATDVTVETGYKVAICPRGNLLYLKLLYWGVLGL